MAFSLIYYKHLQTVYLNFTPGDLNERGSFAESRLNALILRLDLSAVWSIANDLQTTPAAPLLKSRITRHIGDLTENIFPGFYQ